RLQNRRGTREFLGQGADQLRVGAMPGFNRDDMAANPLPEKREVADNIEDFVAHEFIGESQWFLAQDRVAADDDRIFEAASLDQVLVHQSLDVFVKHERPCRRDLAFVYRRGDLGGKKLRELAVWSGLRAGYPEFWVGKHNEERSAFRLDMDRFAHLENAPWRFLFDHSRFLDQLDVRP